MKDKSVRPYQKMEAWREAMALAKRVHTLTADFPREELFGLTASIRECALLVPCGIAQGSARPAPEEYLRLVVDARASLAKLDTLFLVARGLEYIPPHCTIFDDIGRVSRLLSGLMNHLNRMPNTAV